DDYYIVTQSLYSATTSWALNIADDSGHENEARFTTRVSSQQIVYSNIAVTGNEWHHLVGVRNSTSLLIYVDGSLAGSVIDNEAGQNLQSPVNVSIGSAISTSSEDFNGIIDEVRISKVARTAAWLETQYNNQFDPNSFYSVESEEYSPIEDKWAFPQFKYRKTITIDSDQISTDLANFPVLLNLSDSDIHDSGKVQADGDDILFTDSLGTKLDHEIEFFDQTGNSTHAHLVAWVNVPNLLSTSDTNITMYYGNDDIGSQWSPEGVWDSNYLGVWHLSEDPTGTILDSTSHDLDGTSYGSMTSNDQVNGQIDGSLDFDGSDDYINCSDPLRERFDASEKYTCSAWIKAGSIPGGTYPNIVSDETLDGSAGWDFYWYDNTIRVWSCDAYNDVVVSPSLTQGTWYYAVFTYDNGAVELFINGTSVDTGSNTFTDSTGDFLIGVYLNDSYYLDGIIDEVRLSNVVRSSSFIETEYINQHDPDSFYSVGEEEIHESDHWAFPIFRYRKSITIDANKVSGSGSLTDFPVLLYIDDIDLHESGKVQADGDDILFTDSLGNKLDHEIELFDQTGNGTHAYLITWVRVPSLSSTTDTNILMYYGNNAVGNQENPEGVWVDYVGVWHLSEASGDADDSTQYDTTGTASNMNYQVPGVIGYTFNWDEASRLSMGAPADGHLDFGTGNFTISFWINVDEDTGSSQCFMFKGAPTLVGYCLQTDNSPVSHHRAIAQSPTAVEASPSNFTFDEWNYIVMRLDRITDLLYIYSNATEDDTADASALGDIDNFWPLQFPMDSASNDMDGLLDEIRLSNLSRTPEWITTEYQNQKDPNSFYSISSEESYNYWWTDSSFNKRKDIVIVNEKVSADLSDFPVLIDIYDSDLHTGVQGNGADLLFFDMWGTKLDHEIEYFNQSFNSTHAHLIAWVRMPILYNNSDTLISMYYGNNELPSQENPFGVWTKDYKGVWHLPEDPSGPTPQMTDSTSNNNHGTTTNLDTDDQVNGQIDGSIDFDNNQDHINCGNQTSLNTGSGDLSLSLWFNYDAANWGPIAGKGAILGGIRYYLCFSTPAGQITGEIDDDGASGKKSVSSTSTYGDNLWHHVVLVRDGNYLRLYIDGNEDPNSPIDITDYGDLDNIHPFYMNTLPSDNSGTLSSWSTVKLDEVRVSNTAHPENWIVTEYNNQFNSTSFYTVGSEVIFDETPPETLNFGVDDPGTGIGKFWAEITDDSEIASVEITINNTIYSMSWNETYWVYDFSVESFQGYYEYLITNASDIMGNYRATNSSLKYCTFDKDLVDPNVLDWEYYDTLGPYGTFKANITDSWGEIDTVRVNVTTYSMQALMGQYTTFGSNIFAYMNDTLEMANGLMDFQIIVNDTVGNEFVSTTHQGDVFSNHPPIVENLT
ncbi:MAG: DUF2341 domain-containing protein, partial [Candidatus Hodarchaeales archaeon]